MLFLTVKHRCQRYDTVGDYQSAHGQILFTISEMGDSRYECLVAVHELVEKILVDARGISDESIDKFDMKFERARQPGNDEEPGGQPDAPYHREHMFAEKVERMLAEELGIDWDAYEQKVMSL